MTKKILIITFFFFFLIFNIKYVFGQFFDTSFNPNYIISDYELENYSSMDLADIQYFLSKNSGRLKNYIIKNPTTGRLMTAAEVIYRASQEYKINPQYLLVILQKEQSLITDPDPSEKALNWAMGYAICDSCDMNDPALYQYKGFYNQVYNAAKRNRFYIDNSYKEWLFQKGNQYVIDNQIVTPKNQATANLYNYTPHLNGNYNFWKIWQKWFTKKYPNGSIVKEADSPAIWLINEDKREPFITWAAFLSRYKPKNIITINHTDLMKYPIGPSIKFENYSYLKTPDKKIYLLDNDKLKEFESSEVARYMGVNPEEVIDIAWEDFNYYEKGEKITMKSTYPNGAILQDKDNKKIYYAKNGSKYEILDENIIKTNFSDQVKTIVSEEELNKLESGDPVKFQDGTLIKSKDRSAVYIISDGVLRPILNSDIFTKLGYKWSDVVETNDEILNLYTTSDAIEIKSENINPDELLPEDATSKPL